MNILDKLKCPHPDFEANVRVDRIEDTGHFYAGVTIQCSRCKESFRFLGLPAGLDPNGACVSIDGTEARLAIGTNETIANAMESGIDAVGFTIRRTL